MSTHRINLHLSRSESHNSEASVYERHMSQTDLTADVEFLRSFSIESHENQSFQKSNLQRIKEILQKKSERLATGAQRNESTSVYQQLIEKNKEIANLNKTVKQLEEQKKNLSEKNHQLQSLVNDLKKSNKDKENLQKIVKYSKDLINRIKELNLKDLSQIIGPKSEYLSLVKLGKLRDPFTRSLKLSLALINSSFSVREPDRNINEERKLYFTKYKDLELSDLVEDDISSLLKESHVLGSQLNRQKLKISEICKKVESSVQKSKNFIDTFECSDVSSISFSIRNSIGK